MVRYQSYKVDKQHEGKEVFVKRRDRQDVRRRKQVFLSFLATSIVPRMQPLVNTTSGPVVGVINDEGVGVWRGIPYAEAPVGERRWRSPLPRKSWMDVLDATTDGPGCPQRCDIQRPACPTKIDEDCLHLNVFSPGSRRGSGLKKVLFWIHGGDFVQGHCGGPLYDGTSFARDHDLVVVAVNYRLGALGFFF